MSKYTTQLRWIIETYSNNSDLPITQQIDRAAPFIFDFDFPIWNNDYKPVLERKILMHYFSKEIAFETVGLWKLYLNERLNLIMPYYSQLYQTTVNKYDPLTDYDITETITIKREGTEQADYKGNGNTTVTNDSTAEASSTSKDVVSDLPQTIASGGDYATSESDTTQSNNQSSKSSDTTVASSNSTNNIGRNETETHTNNKSGLTGSRSKQDLIQAYRNTILNIDRMIIDELKDLFMMIY